MAYKIDPAKIKTPELKAAEAKEAEIAAARQYLTETDWYVTRKAETNKPIPADVASKRAQARALANREL